MAYSLLLITAAYIAYISEILRFVVHHQTDTEDAREAGADKEKAQSASNSKSISLNTAYAGQQNKSKAFSNKIEQSRLAGDKKRPVSNELSNINYNAQRDLENLKTNSSETSTEEFDTTDEEDEELNVLANLHIKRYAVSC